jgi:hypothetical protein
MDARRCPNCGTACAGVFDGPPQTLRVEVEGAINPLWTAGGYAIPATR